MKNLKSILALLVLTVFSVNVWGETTEELTSTELKNNITNTTCAYSTSKTYTDGTIDYVFYVYTDANSRPWMQLKKDKGVYIKITAPEAIKQVVVKITSATNSSGGVTDITKHTAYSGRLALLESDAAGSAEMTGVAFTDAVSNNIMTLTPSGTNKELYLKVSTGARIWGITVTYGSSCTPGTDLSITSASSVKTGKTIELASTGGNGGIVKWSVENGTGTASISNGILTAGNVGTVTVKAHQDQNGQICETNAQQVFTITPITFTDFITECSGDPEISINPIALTELGYVYGSTESAVQIFTVVGSNLSANVTVTAPAGFEVKQEEGNFDDAIELEPAAGLLYKTISVRLSTGKTAGDYEGKVTISSTEVESKSVDLSATVTPAQLAPPEVTATPAVHQITLSWEAVPNASSYQLSWDGGTPETVTTLSVVKDGLTGGQSYSYSLVAVGTGNYSNSEAAASSAIAGKETYTVNFYVNGTSNPVSIQEGEKVIDHAPTTPDAFDDDFQTFVGWTTEAITGIAPSKPDLITNETVTGEANYYAVFAGETLGNTYTWHKEKTLPDGNYLIAGYSNNDYLMKNTLVSLYYIDADNQGGSYGSYEEPDETNIWKLTTTTDGTTIYNEKIEKYVELYKSGNFYDLGFSDEPCYFTVTAGNNVFTIKSKTYDSYYLVFDPDHSNFAAKNSSSNLYLFKQDVETTGYITNKTNRVTLHYDANAGEEVIAGVPQDARINKNEAFTLPTDQLTRTGYTHLGWNESSTATEAQATITPTEDVTVYAVWQVNSYTLTWGLNGGTVTEEGTPDGSVEFGTTLTAPVLEKTGYTYTWSPAVPETMPASNSTYSAIWTAEEYDIVYKDENDADFSGPTAGLPTTHTYGTATTLVNPTKEHFTFNGWYINSDCSGEPLTSLAADGYTDNITLYAKWTEDTKVTVTFSDAIHNNNSNYQEYVDAAIQFPSITDATPGEDCEGEHYHFVGWTKDASKPNELVTPTSEKAPETDITYYAVWAKASEGGEPTTVFTEDFSSITSGNHTSSNGSSSSWSGNDNFNTANAGWNAVYQAGGAIRIGKSGKVTTKNLDLSAGEVTVTFKMTGWGDNEKMVSVQVGNQTAQSVSCTNSMSSTMEEKSVTFDAGTSSTAVKFTTTSSVRVFLDDIVIKCGPSVTYSNYVTQCTPTYIVNFFTNSGDAEPYATQKVEEGSKATAPETEPSKAGATFAGWFTANDEALADKTITEATDFIAKWNYTAPTITEQPQGGEYTIGSVVTLVVVAEPITDVTFTYQWQRWNGSEYEDITGATIYAYTAPTNQESQNTYRCVVTNGEASTPSAPAQVMVRPASYCAMPTIRIDELGEATAFIREATVTMECGNEGATIYYTVDGSDPKAVGANPETYTAPFKIDATKTIEAYATATDLEPSSVQTKIFTKATLQSIAVETEPKTEYTALEPFDPTDLVITATYNYDLSEDVEYAGHESEFTFDPALTTELGVDVEAVKIGWGEKETEQKITVNCIEIAAPEVAESKQGSTGITLTWSAVENAASYQVKWNGGDAETATSPYVKTGLTDNTNYTYEVIAVGETNYCTSTTGVQNITTNKKSCVSIDNAQIVKTPADFYVGESIEKSQFKVDKHYDNGDVVTEAPSNAEIEGVTNPLTDAEVGTQTVTLTFNYKTTTIEITVKPQPVVTWSINGNEDNKQSFAYNAALVLPEAPAAPQTCAEKTFVGWTTETYKDHDSDEAPAVLFTEAGDRKVTEDVTYYAVFAMVNEVPDEVDVIDNAATVDKLGNTGTSTWVAGFTIEGSTGAKYYIYSMGTKDTEDALRFNGNGYFYATATATSGKYLKSITINGAANKKFDIYASNSAYSAKPTENKLKQITVADGTATYNFEDNYKYIAVNGTESSSTITSVEIVYAGVNEYSAYSTKCAARTPEKIEITHEATKTFDVNDEFTFEGLEITASYNTGNPQVVTDYCVITAPDMTTAGEKDVNISYTENDVTVYTSYKINVRQPYYVMYDPNGATTGSAPSDANKYYTGEKVTVLANESLVKTNNVFKGWSYAGATYQADEQVTVGTEDITLTAVWEEKMPCTITLSENGNISTVTDKSTGDTYNLPTTITNNVDGYAFMGWSTQEIDEPVATTEPGTFFAKGEQMTLTESAYTFYAVYARTSGTSSDYNAGKVTTDADIVAGGLYIIEQAGHVLSSPASDKKAPTEATYKTSGLSTTESYVWTLETSTNGFYLKNMSDNKYLKENGGDMSSVTSNMSEWKFAFQTAGYWKIYAYSSNRFLGFNGANTYLYKAYGSGNYDLTKVNEQYAAQINIYRLVGGYTTAPTIVVNGKTVMDVPADFHGNVIVEDVGDVTLNAATTWKNLTIRMGAKVKTNAALTIKDLFIETKMGSGNGKVTSPNKKGASGQLIIGDGGSVTASGSAIIENQIDPTGTATQGWYSFSVPFPVSAQNGIYFGDAKLTNGVDYAIMEYLGDVRAQGQYGWKKYSGILQPGKMYVIAVTDSDYGKLRFQKTADGALVANNSWTAGIYGGGEATDANWNAIGNPNLAIAQFVNNSGAGTLQFYDHANNTFTVHEKGDLNIVVGSGFFIQAVGEHPNITMNVNETTTRGYRAPAEEAEEKPFVAIQLLQGEAMSDQVFLNADVNATLSYEIGRDVAKFFMQGEAKCAQIYVPAYGTNLCAAQFPLNAYDETMFPLTITAPKEGTYTIAAENVPENVDLFLEQNGALIWNLSTSAYEINLNKGETKDYSIRWNAHSSSTPTGNNAIKSDAKVQKIFYQQNIYILQENQMYNAQGVKVQ